ncbi:MAG TPA: hypothetical protein VNU93_00175 [Verrucomicrobiae bacterium]|nr:hypothetical protein [Verrucomicrobiae bacterium]
MTFPWDDEKWLLEQNAAEYFVEALNEQLSTSYRVMLHADRPDIVIEDEDSLHRLGVEVTHLFYDSAEARALLGRSPIDYRSQEDIKTFIDRLNKLLAQKADKAKKYADEWELALLVRVASPAFGIQDFVRFKNLIDVPDCKYKYIWLLFYNFDESRWNIIMALK